MRFIKHVKNTFIYLTLLHLFYYNKGLCRRTTLRYTVGIFGLCCAAPLFDLTNIYFSIAVAPLNAYFLYLGMYSILSISCKKFNLIKYIFFSLEISSKI